MNPPAASAVAQPNGAALRVSGLSCPSCGGALTVASGQIILACPFCQTTLRVAGEKGIRRFAVKPEVSSDQAKQLVMAWLAKGISKHSALKKEAELAEAFLCFLPFFRSEANAVGYAFGIERRTRTVGSGKNQRTETYDVPVERRLEQHLDQVSVAVNPAEWGLSRIDLSGDELVPFDAETFERYGMVFAPTASEAEAREDMLADFADEADPAAGLHQTHFRFLELLSPRFSLVYYPLWVVRYRFRGKSYQVLIDAESGDLAYGKAPGNDVFRAAAMVGSQAAACFLVTSGLQWSFSGDVDNPFALIFGACAVGVAIFLWGFKKFRFGGVVEEGTGYQEPASAGKFNLKAIFAKGGSG
ncbi:MAG TPA: hypothetical protein PK413_06575 [Thermoanaerobaculia bacterium]|nr:hypothetical protein [Thermoanaerobaculia bacterium]